MRCSVTQAEARRGEEEYRHRAAPLPAFTPSLLRYLVHINPRAMGNRVAREDYEWVYTDQPHADRRKEILGELAYRLACF